MQADQSLIYFVEDIGTRFVLKKINIETKCIR